MTRVGQRGTLLLAWSAALALGACDADSGEPELPAEAAAGKADGLANLLVDGTPEAIGVLKLVNHPSTTEDVLDDDVGLDRRAAESITDFRAGPDGAYTGGTHDDGIFRAIAEVDDQYYVGAAALQHLLDYAFAHDFVPEGGDLLGVWDNVAFTVDEARDALTWINESPEDVLDARLDRRAVDSVMAARPVPSIQALSKLYFFGQSAMLTAREEGRSVGEGLLCTDNSQCTGILQCVGVPNEDGFQQCLASQDIPGQHESCTGLGQCNDDLVCSGFTIFSSGECRPAWMAADFTSEVDATIAAGTAAQFTVDVAGLATVPEDIVVTVDLSGIDPADVRIVIADPQGTESHPWDGPAAGGAPMPTELLALDGISRDDNINGTWTLTVENLGSTDANLSLWNLYLSSRFD